MLPEKYTFVPPETFKYLMYVSRCTFPAIIIDSVPISLHFQVVMGRPFSIRGCN